jgi:hypothetical protein
MSPVYQKKNIHNILEVALASKCSMWQDLHFAAKVPEYRTEEKSYHNGKKKPNGIVRRVPPVGQILLPQASNTLLEKRL